MFKALGYRSFTLTEKIINKMMGCLGNACLKFIYIMRFEISTAVKMCNLCFVVCAVLEVLKKALHPTPAMQTEVTRSSETLDASYKTIWHHDLEDHNPLAQLVGA